MTRQPWPAPDLDADLDIVWHLSIEVRPAERPSRWAWHLVDRRDSSEFERELEYDSSIDAQRAGLARLAELRAFVLDASATRLYRKSA